MSGLALTLRDPPRQRLDLSPLTPDRLAGLDEAAIAAIELISGNQRLRVGDLFAIAIGDPADLSIRNACDKLDFIGRAMTDGTITVEGDAGAYVGLGLRGGRIHVRGGVGPWAGAEMHRGVIEIDGDAGDFTAGAVPGETKGMRGGLVIVRGNAGHRAGDRMRRGILVIEGSVGSHAGSRMIAGTVAVLGAAVGPYPGFGMKRGSLILSSAPERPSPTFADCGAHDLGFLKLLPQAVGDRSSRLAELWAMPPRVRRFAGDLAAGGMGEILIRRI
ncbi:formylmethanofuran dehydrogenase subunit C [Rhodospirillaceae bacterium SYSU D60014]|uniref:formylmethanofuran dehydrogenase subunit C n=1 Tax=Virgifigura deserti TaxID=2268457 RepID=UPI000E665B12